MFSKTSFSIFLVGLLLFGFAFLSQPQSASAGAGPMGLGCCVNNGGNCNPGCGSQGDDCFRNFTEMGNAPCPSEQVSDCGGVSPTNKGCFIVGMTCFQVENNTGECRPAEDVPDPVECETADTCDDPDPDCFTPVCESTICGLVATGDPSCEPAPPTGPTTIIPTMGQWGMVIATILLGFFAVRMLRNRKDSEI